MSTRLLRAKIEHMVSEAGSFRAAAKRIGCDHSYLWRVHQGSKNPSRQFLAKLGLMRVTVYQRLK